MTLTAQAEQIRAAIEAWGKEKKVVVRVAGDVVEFVNILRSKPGAVRIAIAFDEEPIRGDIEELGRVDRRWMIGISRGRGLSLEPADSLTEGTAGGDPLFQLYEELREVVRGLAFEEESGEAPVYFKTGGRLEIPGVILDAFRIQVEIGTQLPVYV